MSKIKAYYESVAQLAAGALFEEGSKYDQYYQLRTYAEIEEEVMDQIFDGDSDDVLDELMECMFYYESDLVAEFPKSFSAACSLYPTGNSITDDRWKALIAGASNFPVFKALIDAYEEYRDMSDPWLNEAKEWIGELMYKGDYDGLLNDINTVIENYELTEEESPVTFKAKAMLESMVNS